MENGNRAWKASGTQGITGVEFNESMVAALAHNSSSEQQRLQSLRDIQNGGKEKTLWNFRALHNWAKSMTHSVVLASEQNRLLSGVRGEDKNRAPPNTPPPPPWEPFHRLFRLEM